MTKLGPHILVPTVAALNWVDVAPIVKSIDNVAVLVAAPPNAIRVFRHYMANQNLNDPQGTVDAILGALGGYRHPNLFCEVLNEPATGQPAPLVAFYETAVSSLHAAGVKVAGPSWSTGSFNQIDWDGFRAAHWAGLDLIAVHCYFGLAGFTIYEGVRYRQFWKPGDPPVVITETGIDDV